MLIDCLIKQYNGEEEKKQQHPQQAATLAEAAGTAIAIAAAAAVVVAVDEVEIEWKWKKMMMMNDWWNTDHTTPENKPTIMSMHQNDSNFTSSSNSRSKAAQEVT